MSLQNEYTCGNESKDQLSFYSNNQNFLGVFDVIISCLLMLASKKGFKKKS